MKLWKCVSIMAVFLLVSGFGYAQENGEITSNDILGGADDDDSGDEADKSDPVTSITPTVEETKPVTKLLDSSESSEPSQEAAEISKTLLIPISHSSTVPSRILPEEIPIYKDPSADFCNANCVEPNCASCFGSSDICCQKCCLNIPRVRISNDFCISNCETLECKDCHGSKNPCCLNCCPAIPRTRKSDTYFCTENCPSIDCNGFACPSGSNNPCCLNCCSPIPETIVSGILKDKVFCSQRCPGVDCNQCGKIQSTHFCCNDCCPSVLGALQRRDAEFLKNRNPGTRNIDNYNNNNNNNNPNNNHNNNFNNNNRNNNFENRNRGTNFRGDCN